MSATVLLLTSILIVVLVVILTAAPVSERLVRACARRLPKDLAHRMEEEWRAELNALTSRPAKLAFAIALMLTRRRAFAVPGEDVMMTEAHDRLGSLAVLFGGWKSLLLIPTAVFALAAYGASFLLPLRYQSEALVLVRGQYPLTTLAPLFLQPSIEGQFEWIRLEVESNKKLLTLVPQDSRYGNLSIGSIEDRIQRFRDDITIRFVPMQGGGQSGTISVRYVGSDPITVQQVTHQLTRGIAASFLSQRQERFDTPHVFDARLNTISAQLTEYRDRIARDRGTHGSGEDSRLALDYELLKAEYRKVFSQREELQTLIAMEKAQEGQLQVLETPYQGVLVGPNRLAIAAVGALGGLSIGGMAVVGLNRRSQRRLLA